MEKTTLPSNSDSLGTDDLTDRGNQDPMSADDRLNEPSDDRSSQRTEWDDPLVTDADALSQRWESVQNSFVDEPRRAVEQADALVAETIQKLADTFSTARQRLESQWSGGEEVSTEDLRQALRRYRSFFNRLLEQSSEPEDGQRRADDIPRPPTDATASRGVAPNSASENDPPRMAK